MTTTVFPGNRVTVVNVPVATVEVSRHTRGPGAVDVGMISAG